MVGPGPSDPEVLSFQSSLITLEEKAEPIPWGNHTRDLRCVGHLLLYLPIIQGSRSRLLLVWVNLIPRLAHGNPEVL